MLNLEFYKGNDLYSDGDIENELLDIFKSNNNIEEVIANDTRWPILYHLDPVRKNLLEWFPFDKKESLLEIGSGCGALTELFCDRLGSVTAIELSKRRSEINMERNKKCKNLEIVVGNLEDVKINKKFDYITLIGVLEYTRSFVKGVSPYKDIFDRIKKWLKPGGSLIIAIENKFGLKYWCGARDDHSGVLFDSLQGYMATGNKEKFETFGLEELKNLLKDNGFNDQEMYYPYPDYKLPEAIYSDKFLPDISSLFRSAPNYDQDRITLFNECTVFLNIIKNKQFPFFSNSFLCITKVS